MIISSQFSYIYTLSDPDTMAIHYVGRSTNPFSRFNQHVNSTESSRVGRWLQKLVKANKEPVMEVVDHATLDNVRELEQRWIQELSLVCRLLNHYR